jgi:predicted esterase
MPDLSPAIAGASEQDASVAAILLHGRWQTPQYMIEVAGRIAAPDVAYVAPPAPGGTWYPETFLAPYETNRHALEASLARVHGEVGALLQRGWSRDRIALIGFSQGACLAAEYVWRHPGRWAGLAIFTGSLVAPQDDPSWAGGDLAGTPVIVSNGDADPWVPWDASQATAARFTAAGAAVEVQLHPGREHLVNDAEAAAAHAMLAAAVVRARKNLADL